MYPTDLTETQWQYIKKELMLQDRKRKHDLRNVWNAIFYLVKTGCQWRMLPQDFPNWNWFITISANGVFWKSLICY